MSRMHEQMAADMPTPAKDWLIRHIDHPIKISTDYRRSTANYLLRRGLVRACRPEGGVMITTRPMMTELTEDGRMVVGWVLARYADALIAAGALERQHLIMSPPLAPVFNAILRTLGERRGAPKEGVPDEYANTLA